MRRGSFVALLCATAATLANAAEERPLAELLPELSSSDASARKQAAGALKTRHVANRSALRALAKALSDEDNAVSVAAAEALIAAGEPAVPYFIQALWHKEGRVRFMAVVALGKLNSAARSAVRPLVARLLDAESPVRAAAVNALRQIDAYRAVDAISRLIDDSDPRVQIEAVDALGSLHADAARMIEIARKWMRDKIVGRRLLAVRLLWGLGPEAAPAADLLIAALADEQTTVRRYAAVALGRIGPRAKNAVERLLKLARSDADPHVRLSAVESLWRIDRHAEASTLLVQWARDGKSPQHGFSIDLLRRIGRTDDAVATAIRDCKAKPRDYALAQLSLMGPQAKRAAPQLAAILEVEPPAADVEADTYSPNDGARALIALGEIGPAAKPHVGIVAGLLQSRDEMVRVFAARALWQIQRDERALVALARLTSASQSGTRRMAIRELGQRGTAARSHAAALLPLLHHKDKHLRLDAADALWRITRDERALRTAVSLLGDDDVAVRNAAALTLGATFGSGAAYAVDALIAALWDSDIAVRSGAAEALGRIGPAARKATPALIALLASSEQPPSSYSSAAEALGLFGAHAKAASPILKKRLAHPHPQVRANCALALWQIARDRAGLAVAAAGLNSRNYQTRVYSAEAVWAMQHDPRVVAVLLDVLWETTPNNNNRYMAARGLGRIGPAAQAAVPALQRLLHDEDPAMRDIAAEAIDRIAK